MNVFYLFVLTLMLSLHRKELIGIGELLGLWFGGGPKVAGGGEVGLIRFRNIFVLVVLVLVRGPTTRNTCHRCEFCLDA